MISCYCCNYARCKIFRGYQNQNSNIVTTLVHLVGTFQTLKLILSKQCLKSLFFCFPFSCYVTSHVYYVSSVCLSVCLCVDASSVDPDPSAAAAVDPAGPSSAPGCSRAAFSQPAEQHHWGEHLSLRSHTHYPAAPVTAHPDHPSKTQSFVQLLILKIYFHKISWSP